MIIKCAKFSRESAMALKDALTKKLEGIKPHAKAIAAGTAIGVGVTAPIAHHMTKDKK